MDNRTRNRRLRQLQHKEVNDMCARYEEECRYLGSHQETEEEKQERLKRADCELKRKNRWTLHS